MIRITLATLSLLLSLASVRYYFVAFEFHCIAAAVRSAESGVAGVTAEFEMSCGRGMVLPHQFLQRH